MQVTIFRNTDTIVQIEIDDRTVFTQKLMGEHKIVADFIHDSPLPVQLGDYIEHRNERFYINTPPQVEKINNFTYRYVVNFEGEIYRLYNKIFMHEGQADFSYHGTPEDFLLLLLENINSIDTGWAIEKVDPAAAQTLSFNSSSCRTALTTIAEAFGLEYRLPGKNIILEKNIGSDTTLQFQYGRGLGLYKLNRNRIEDKNVITRVYGFGARKNLNFDYRNGAQRLLFEEKTLETNTALYGIIEGSVTFDDIFPQRTGVVTGIDPEEALTIKDTALDFDINEYLLEGTTAKIVFKSGALSGYEFEIEGYDHSVNKIKFIPFVEENGYTLPNDLNFPEVGDEYTLVDIKMPQVYIDEAEIKLRERTQEFLNENSVPRVIYTIEIDEKFVREQGVDLQVGHLVTVLDDALGINSKIRVAEVSYPLVNPDKVTAVIADTIPYTDQERLIANAIDANTEIVNVDRQGLELARRSALRFKRLQEMVFDPDGYFDPEHIKPSSIETLMLSVGARSQAFGLIGVRIQANASNNANTLDISGGQLAHYQIEIEGLGYVWEMDPETFINLDPLKSYYVYARCSATSLTGTWAISETPKPADAETGKYLFNLGILYPVAEGRRDFDFTNGMTYINGDTITTGKIKSMDGLNFFDLSAGKFKIGNKDSSLDFNVTEAGKLTLKGVLVSSMIFAEDAVIENLKVRSLRTADEGRRLEILEALNNLILYNSAGEEVARVDDDIDTDAVGTKLGGLKTRNPADGVVSYVSGNGVFSNAGRTQFYSATTGKSTRASIVGLLTETSGDISAAVAGVYLGNTLGVYGGFFDGGLRVDGGFTGLEVNAAVHFNTARIDTNTTLNNTSHIVSCYNTSSINVLLPSNPQRGREIVVRRMNSSAVSVSGNGKKIHKEFLEDSIDVGPSKGDGAIFRYDGQNWLYNIMNR